MGIAGGPEMLTADALLDELRLDGLDYVEARDGALLRHLVLAEAARLSHPVEAEEIEETAARFRRAHGLATPRRLRRWLLANDLGEEHFAALMRDETLLAWARHRAPYDVVMRLPDHLRATGEYDRLRARARDKQQMLARAGLDNPGLADAGVPARVLLRWYFKRLGRPVTRDVERYAYAAGFDHEDAFWRALIREYCYVRARRRPRQRSRTRRAQ